MMDRNRRNLRYAGERIDSLYELLDIVDVGA